MKEIAAIKRFLVWATRLRWRLFRNAVGVGFAGRELRSYPSSTRNGAATIYEVVGNRIRYGLQEGSGDLIGWRPVRITSDMVGTVIAQFTSVEMKTPGVRAQKEQLQWRDAVNSAGGYAVIVREGPDGWEFDEGRRDVKA